MNEDLSMFCVLRPVGGGRPSITVVSSRGGKKRKSLGPLRFGMGSTGSHKETHGGGKMGKLIPPDTFSES